MYITGQIHLCIFQWHPLVYQIWQARAPKKSLFGKLSYDGDVCKKENRGEQKFGPSKFEQSQLERLFMSKTNLLLPYPEIFMCDLLKVGKLASFNNPDSRLYFMCSSHAYFYYFHRIGPIQYLYIYLYIHT